MAEHWQQYSFRRTRVEGSLSNEKLYEQFALVDSDTSGYIEAGELEQAVKMWAFNTGQPAPDSQEMLAFADVDHDGRISFDEFIKVMRYIPPKEGTIPPPVSCAAHDIYESNRAPKLPSKAPTKERRRECPKCAYRWVSAPPPPFHACLPATAAPRRSSTSTASRSAPSASLRCPRPPEGNAARPRARRIWRDVRTSLAAAPETRQSPHAWAAAPCRSRRAPRRVESGVRLSRDDTVVSLCSVRQSGIHRGSISRFPQNVVT